MDVTVEGHFICASILIIQCRFHYCRNAHKTLGTKNSGGYAHHANVYDARLNYRRWQMVPSVTSATINEISHLPTTEPSAKCTYTQRNICT